MVFDEVAVDQRLRELAQELAAGTEQDLRGRVETHLLGLLMRSRALRVGVFRLVEAYPALHSDQVVLDRIEEELGHDDAPWWLRGIVRLARIVPGGRWLAARISSAAIEATAMRFIAGRDPQDAVPVLEQLWARGTGVVVDALGEKTVTGAEADRYVERVSTIVDRLGSEVARWDDLAIQSRDHHGPLPPVAVAIKPTACSPLFAPETWQRGLDDAARRLGPILDRAAASDVFVWFDMEQHRVAEMTDQLFRRLAEEHPRVDLGIVVQAYLRDSHDELTDLVSWARTRPRPIGVRLVKGAYWDHETVTALANDWPVPVFQQKWASDANYDRCARLLVANADVLRPAFASHNLRSLSHALAVADEAGLPREAVEVEVLHGMAGQLPGALARLGVRTRVYVPIGRLVPGMSYLVRRLLENTSNESFLRQQDVAGADLTTLLAPPPSLTTADPLPTDLERQRTTTATSHPAARDEDHQ